MSKEIFETPLVEIVSIDADVITASGSCSDPNMMAEIETD